MMTTKQILKKKKREGLESKKLNFEYEKWACMDYLKNLG